jgi:hypothetical protein
MGFECPRDRGGLGSGTGLSAGTGKCRSGAGVYAGMQGRPEERRGGFSAVRHTYRVRADARGVCAK